MKWNNKVAVIGLLMYSAVMIAGCGGRSGSGAVADLPAPPEARGTLKFSNVTAKTVITVDGQPIPASSGTVSVEVAPGVHAVSVARAGYILTNSADLQSVPVAVGAVTEKPLSFTREITPMPDDWDAAARIAGQPAGEAPPAPPLP